MAYKKFEQPKKHCETCGQNIKGKPILYDDYYFCSQDCVRNL